jgi:hypothetical protein
MGEKNLFDARVHFFDRLKNPLHVSAGIHDGGLAGDFTLYNGAILLVGRNRYDGALNGHFLTGSYGKNGPGRVCPG